jgi:hypothetical protein
MRHRPALGVEDALPGDEVVFAERRPSIILVRIAAAAFLS